jgi:site-specific DNA-methyltransferase (adenine-specific)
MTSKLYLGDCLDILATLDENSIDTCITDPPYGLGFMGKEWDTFDKSQFGLAGNEGENDLKVKKNFKVLPRYNNGAGLYDFTLEWASQVYRVLKPGGLLLAFGGTRTYHRLVCGIEDAGFEIRDTIGWVYGSGFPKSLDISKAIDKQAGAEGEVIGKEKIDIGIQSGSMHAGRESKIVEREVHAPATSEAQLWNGWGTALKPAMELIVVAMKPLGGTYAENALKWGVAGYWIDGGRIGFTSDADYQESTQKNRHGDFNSNNGIRVPTKGIYHGDNRPPVNYEPKDGRFPTNLIHDGSDEVLELFPQTGKSTGGRIGNKGSALNMMGTNYEAGDPGYGDSGSAARFFYCAKASRSERNAGLDIAEQNLHPTVKPIALMRYLVRLTKTPTGGTVLDPFMGSGTTGIACALEGREFIGIEKEREYYEIAEKRINYWSAQPSLL